MPTPLFDGLPIFGPACVVLARRNPVGRSWSAYPGLHGRQSVHQGSRGSSALATGRLIAADVPSLRALEDLIETYLIDGAAYPLLDSGGVVWPNMILIDYEPTAPMDQDENGVYRDFRAVFEGLF